MSNPFHLAIPAEDLTKSTKFYVDILGVKQEMEKKENGSM